MKNPNKENNNTFRNTFRIDNRIRSMYNKTMRKTVDGLSVEWDECKNISNIKKRKLSFKIAMLVFTDRKDKINKNNLRSQCNASGKGAIPWEES